MEGHKLRSL